jgi:hypothetical protein
MSVPAMLVVAPLEVTWTGMVQVPDVAAFGSPKQSVIPTAAV